MLPTVVKNRTALPRKGGGRCESYTIDLTPCCPNAVLVAAYLRISKEDTEKDKGGIDRQFDIALERAHKEHKCLGRVYVDDDLSATKPRLIRPAFAVLLQELRSGSWPGGIAVQHQDRLFRLMKDLLKLTETNDEHRPLVIVTGDRVFDLGNDDDVMLLELGAIMGRREVKSIGRRVRDTHKQRAQLGLRTGGSRNFGWNATPDAYHAMGNVLQSIKSLSEEAFRALDKNDMREAMRVAEDDARLFTLIDEYKAAKNRILRERSELKCPFESELWLDARRRIVARTATPGSIVSEWTQKGIRGPMSGLWKNNRFVRAITSPRMAGYRMYKDVVVEGPDGKWVKGTQHAIFTDAEYQELLSVLEYMPEHGGRSGSKVLNGVVLKKQPHGNRRRLLSGLLLCGACQGPMYFKDLAKQKAAGKATVAGLYRCDTGPACQSRVAVTAVHVERVVLTLVGRHVAQLPAAAPEDQIEEVWERQLELDRLNTTRDYWSKQMDDPEADMTYAVAQVREREVKIRDLVAERREWQKKKMAATRPVTMLDPSEFRLLAAGAAEEESTMVQLRTLLDRYLSGVRVLPQTQRKGGHFDHERLVPIWWRPQESDTSREPVPV